MAGKSPRIPPELEDIAALVGEFIEYWGFKNVHGRMWTHLFTAERALDAGDLIERLEISKALVSMTISDLLEYEVIQVAGKSQRGTVLFCANPNLTTVIMSVLRKRERRMLGRISSAARLLKELPKDAQGEVKLSDARLDTLSDLVKTAESALDSMLQLSGCSFADWEKFNNLPDADKEPT